MDAAVLFSHPFGPRLKWPPCEGGGDAGDDRSPTAACTITKVQTRYSPQKTGNTPASRTRVGYSLFRLTPGGRTKLSTAGDLLGRFVCGWHRHGSNRQERPKWRAAGSPESCDFSRCETGALRPRVAATAPGPRTEHAARRAPREPRQAHYGRGAGRGDKFFRTSAERIERKAKSLKAKNAYPHRVRHRRKERSSITLRSRSLQRRRFSFSSARLSSLPRPFSSVLPRLFRRCRSSLSSSSLSRASCRSFPRARRSA